MQRAVKFTMCRLSLIPACAESDSESAGRYINCLDKSWLRQSCLDKSWLRQIRQLTTKSNTES